MNKENIPKAFSHILRKIRQKAGLSQEQLAFESDLHRTYISLLERGLRVPSLTATFQISSALNIKP